MKKLVIAAIIVVGLIAVCGTGSTKKPDEVTIASAVPAAAPQAQLKVGDTIKSGNWQYTVTKSEKVKTLQWSEFGNKKDALGMWLVVSITLRNVGERNFTINVTDFQVQDSTAAKYDPSSAFEAYSFVTYRKLTPLGSQFPPGLDVNSAIVFDVNPSATGLQLVLKQANNRTIALE